MTLTTEMIRAGQDAVPQLSAVEIAAVWRAMCAAAPVAAQAQPEGVTLDGCLETLYRLGEYLGVDYAASRKAEGAPSGVYIKAIEAKIAAAQQSVSGADGLPAGVAQFTKKPVTISAIQWTGGNLKEVIAFTGMHPRFHEWFSCWDEYVEHVGMSGGIFKIFTLEGVMEATPGDWIIRGVKGEHYPCKPDIFAATYEPAQPQPSGNAGELESFSAWANDYCEMHQLQPGKFSSKITQFAFMAWQARAALAARASANICNADKRQIPASQLQARGLDKDNIDAARAAAKGE